MLFSPYRGGGLVGIIANGGAAGNYQRIFGSSGLFVAYAIRQAGLDPIPFKYTTYAVVGIQHTRPAPEWAGYEYEGHLRGLTQPAEAGFVAVAEGFSPAGIGHRVTTVN
jgi:hypothetical protein